VRERKGENGRKRGVWSGIKDWRETGESEKKKGNDGGERKEGVDERLVGELREEWKGGKVLE
jgi:hypothetical protein